MDNVYLRGTRRALFSDTRITPPPHSPPDIRLPQQDSAPEWENRITHASIVLSASPAVARCQWWAPIIVQRDLRLWLAPSTRQRRDIEIALGNVNHLADPVLPLPLVGSANLAHKGA